MSPGEAAACRRLHDAREEERVCGEQAWQLASPFFAVGLVVPVFAPAGWRMPSFALGMGVAVIIWSVFKLRAGRAAREARAAENELAALGASAEPGGIEEAGSM